MSALPEYALFVTNIAIVLSSCVELQFGNYCYNETSALCLRTTQTG